MQKKKKVILSITITDMLKKVNPFESLKQYQIRDLLIEKTNNYFLCGLCKLLALLPVECAICQQIYCYDCVNTLQNYQCPKNEEYESHNMYKKECHTTIKKLYFQQMVKCPECLDQLSLSQLINHNEFCTHTIEKCTNNGCTFISKDIKKHQEICEFRQITCKQCDCQYQITEKHNCITYLKKMISNMESSIEQIKKKVKLDEDKQIFKESQIKQEEE